MASKLNQHWFKTQADKMAEEHLRNRGIRDPRVLQAMAKVPRHIFVAEEYRSQAYDDHPIPIGDGQTISQPYMVARMLEALTLVADDVILEIGTGSGYQTALLAELCNFVFSIERHPALASEAQNTLTNLGYTNVKISVGDGSQGLPASAPFDAIVVSAAASAIPPALFDQLREVGRMIIPVGPAHYQQLQLVRKRNGLAEIAHLEACRFVPLIWESGQSTQK